MSRFARHFWIHKGVREVVFKADLSESRQMVLAPPWPTQDLDLFHIYFSDFIVAEQSYSSARAWFRKLVSVLYIVGSWLLAARPTSPSRSLRLS